MSRKKIFLRKGSEVFLAAVMLFTAVSCGDDPPQEMEFSDGKQEQKQTASVSRKKKKPAFSDSSEGSLKVRFSSVSETPEKVRVRIDHSNVTVLSGQNVPPDPSGTRRISQKERKLRSSMRTRRPASALSSGIISVRSVSAQTIRWRPRMRGDTSSRSRIECCVSSPDESVILFVETVGEEQGPYGSRLVFLDTHSWKIIAFHHLESDHVKEVSFLRDGSCLLSCRGQAALQSKDSVIHFDTVVFRALSRYKVDGLRKAWAAPDGKHFLCTYRKESADPRKITLHALDGSDDLGVLRSVTGENSEPVLAFSGDGSLVYSCGERSLESRSIRDLRKHSSSSLPEGFVCADLLVLPDGSQIAAPTDGLRQKNLRIRNGTSTPFGEIAAGCVFSLPSPRQNQFGTLLSRKGKVGCYALPALDETLEIFPEECRERTVGNPWRVFVLKHCPEVFAVLDQSGNFYLLYRGKNERRFRKEILISGLGRKKK